MTAPRRAFPARGLFFDGQPKMIHEALKRATRPSHEALDSGVGEGLTGITLSGYRHMLGRFLGLFEPIERDLLRSEKLAAVLPDFADRLRTPSLVKDLRALGMTEEEVAALPRCENTPAVDDLSRALGCVYVLEGSRLGGTYISRSLRDRLGPEVPCAFFSSEGREVGPAWKALLNTLDEEHRRGADESAMTAAAIETFDVFKAWL